MDAHLTTPPDRGPIDPVHLDGTLAHLRRAAQTSADVATSMAEARDRLVAAPDDIEARHAMRMAALHMRGEAAALAELFATMARPEWAAP